MVVCLSGPEPRIARRRARLASAVSTRSLNLPGGRLQILLVNFTSPGAQRLLVRLRVPKRFGAGPILRLTAPSPRSTAGVALGGAAVGLTGTWTPATRLPRVTGVPGSLLLGVPPSSAALITLPPTSGGPPLH